jgi:mono/diheme cytochrome c family protein
MAACSSGTEDLREWTPADHAHAPDAQIDPTRVPQKEAPDFTVGELLWMRNCARCHGADGQGGREASIDFTAAQWQDGIDDAKIARTILAGKPPDMPAFADLLSSEQISELVKQVRSFGDTLPLRE